MELSDLGISMLAIILFSQKECYQIARPCPTLNRRLGAKIREFAEQILKVPNCPTCPPLFKV
jgi:hypothetical protein